MLNYLWSSVYSLSLQQLIVENSKEPNTFTCRFQKRKSLSNVGHVSHAFIPTMLFLYRGEKDVGIIFENKHINGLKINCECVIITFNHRFSVLNIYCSPCSMLMPLCFESGINIDLGPQQTLIISNPWLNLMYMYFHVVTSMSDGFIFVHY